MASVQSVISDYVVERSGRPPQPDAKTGGYELAVDGRYIIQIWEFGPNVIGRIWLGDLPSLGSDRGAKLRGLMRRQLAELGKDDVILSVDEQSNEFYLHRPVPSAGFSTQVLVELLQSLLNAVERYHHRTEAATPIQAAPIPQMIIRP